MARHHFSSDSESSDNEGAPETISLTQSKKDIRKLDAALKRVEVAVRQSKRRQNREVDRKLKVRAGINKGGEKMGDEAAGLEARMQQAKQETQEEVHEGGSESERVGGGDSENSGEEDEEDESGLKNGQGSKGEEAEILSLTKLPSKKKTHNANHLPDELFTAAFASKAPTSKRKTTEEDNPQCQTRKKSKRSQTHKDIIVGSGIIRMLPTPGQPITPSVAPSSKVNKFLNRSLALKGGIQRSKTWERRPANIGVFRRDGPASNFVRNR